MDTDFSDIISDLLNEAVNDLKTFFVNIVRSERMKESDEYSDNPEESAQMQEEIDATDIRFEVSGTQVMAEIVTSGSAYDKISTEGKEISYSGGQNGIVTYPDGHKEPSKVPVSLQGQPVPDSEEPKSVWKENAIKIIKSLLPGQIRDYLQAKLGERIAPIIGQMLSSQLAGGVA